MKEKWYHSPTIPRLAGLTPGLFIPLLTFTLVGCGGPGGSPHGPAISGEMRAQLMKARMQASGAFFANRIGVEANLSPGLHGPAGRGDRGGPPRERRGGGPGDGDMAGGPPPGGGMRGGGDFDGPRRPAGASTLPPLQLRLALTNHGDAEVTVEVLDFNSALGNFVVQPDTLVIVPGATVEPEPMTSRLGIPGDEIPLTIRLRLNGQTEQQVLILKPIDEPAPQT